VIQIPRPIDVLPHRPPFLFLDSVDELEVGVRAKGRWHLTGEEWFFGGHFPGRPTLPGVLQAEAIAQLGAFTALTDPKFAGKLALLGGLDSARFRRQCVPGDHLVIEAEISRMSTRGGKGGGRVLVNGHVACEAELMFVLISAVRT
jgi:3-hydroxyacyl-[acyl-carrier-protein] dehydratase